MKIHVISTVNGIQNEGMRNVATHISRYFEQENEVVYSSLRDLVKIPFRCKTSDVTFLFVRCVGKVYPIARLCGLFTKYLNIVIVQKPDADFIAKNNKHPLKCDIFTICKEDAEGLKPADGYSVKYFEAGINSEKFCPVTAKKRAELKKKYGIPEDKPLVLHVGHCSAGRGLEDFIQIDENQYERLIIASGLFENEKTVSALKEAKIRVISEYIEHINEYFQMADAYLFPTRSGEFVISVPLSVMEALSCGTPAIAYSSFSKMSAIQTNTEGAITFISTIDEIGTALEKAVAMKSDHSLLASPKSWEEVAQQILNQTKVK